MPEVGVSGAQTWSFGVSNFAVEADIGAVTVDYYNGGVTSFSCSSFFSYSRAFRLRCSTTFAIDLVGVNTCFDQ